MGGGPLQKKAHCFAAFGKRDVGALGYGEESGCVLFSAEAKGGVDETSPYEEGCFGFFFL